MGRATTRGERGFSLAEVIVTMVIIGILSAIALPLYNAQRSKANRAAAEQDARAISTQMTEMFADVVSWGAAPRLDGTIVDDTATLTLVNADGSPTSATATVGVSSSTEWYEASTPDDDNPYAYCIVVRNNGQYAKFSATSGVALGDSALHCP